MQVNDIIKKLEDNSEFKAWKKENYASSLVHIFKMFDEANKDEVQVGYINSDETITTWIVSDEVKMVDKQEAFKKPDTKINKLSIEDVKVDIDDAIKKARDFQKEEYKQEKPIKEILILQHLDVGQVYNITFVTQAFKTLNIKISVDKGDIVKHELISLMDMDAK